MKRVTTTFFDVQSLSDATECAETLTTMYHEEEEEKKKKRCKAHAHEDPYMTQIFKSTFKQGAHAAAVPCICQHPSTRNSCAGARHAMFMYITCAQIAEHEMVFQSCNVQRGLAAGGAKKEKLIQ